MKKLLLAIIFASFIVNAYAGPFGLKPGMLVEEANKVGPARETNKFRKFSKGGTSPYTHRAYFEKNPGSLTATFIKLQALFDPKMGLIAIETEGRVPRKQSKEKFSEIVQSLTKKYGDPSGTKKQRINPLIFSNDLLITTTWPTVKRKEIIDLSVSWREQAAIGDLIKIKYWFVPEKFVMDKITKAKAKGKSATETKAKKELEDL